MPDPNVRKLAEIFREWSETPTTRSYVPGGAAQSFAEFAASRGVLVVSDAVLTNEAVASILEDVSS